MEAVLNGEWLETVDEASVALARAEVRRVAAGQGLSAADAERLATIASELAHNQIAHASGGRVRALPISRGDHRGVEIRAEDEGGGILDPARALEGTPRPASAASLGFGLASVVRLAREVDLDVRIGEGTRVRARVFGGEAPRRRVVGVYGRPIRGEPRSGDDAAFARADDDDALVLGVIDGLGHGPHARAASSAAAAVLLERASDPPARVVEASHGALASTRGAVMAVARLDEARDTLDLASMGNVSVMLVGPRHARRFGGSSFVVGSPQRGAKSATETAAIAPDDVLVMFSDGVASRASIEDDLDLQREHPVVIAQRIVERFARDGDDVLVMVAR